MPGITPCYQTPQFHHRTYNYNWPARVCRLVAAKLSGCTDRCLGPRVGGSHTQDQSRVLTETPEHKRRHRSREVEPPRLARKPRGRRLPSASPRRFAMPLLRRPTNIYDALAKRWHWDEAVPYRPFCSSFPIGHWQHRHWGITTTYTHTHNTWPAERTLNAGPETASHWLPTSSRARPLAVPSFEHPPPGHTMPTSQHIHTDSCKTLKSLFSLRLNVALFNNLLLLFIYKIRQKWSYKITGYNCMVRFRVRNFKLWNSILI